MTPMIVMSLDADLTPGVVMLEFGSKTPIATVDGRWLYRMAGNVSLPKDRAVYGLCFDETWVLSRNVRVLLDWKPAP